MLHVTFNPNTTGQTGAPTRLDRVRPVHEPVRPTNPSNGDRLHTLPTSVQSRDLRGLSIWSSDFLSVRIKTDELGATRTENYIYVALNKFLQ